MQVENLQKHRQQQKRSQVYPNATSAPAPVSNRCPVLLLKPYLPIAGGGGSGRFKGPPFVPRVLHGCAEAAGPAEWRRQVSASGWAAEAFGQHEALTTRLKHIIDAYADGPGILFELIQNAVRRPPPASPVVADCPTYFPYHCRLFVADLILGFGPRF